MCEVRCDARPRRERAGEYLGLRRQRRDGRTLYDLYSEAYTPWEWQPELKAIADKLGIDLFSAVYDSSAVEFLEEIGVPAHNVASFEIVDLPLITRMAETEKPLLISTGMASWEEIEEAVAAAREAGATQVALLKATSAYPAPPKEMHPRAIPEMEEAFGVPVGLSDHSLGIEVPIAAVTLGACLVEKNFTLSRDTPSADAAFSLEVEEFRAMVDAGLSVEASLGEARPPIGPEEAKSRVFRRSLFVIQDVKAGEKFTEQNLRSIRPGNGLHPRHLKEILGRVAARDVPRGTPMAWDLLS